MYTVINGHMPEPTPKQKEVLDLMPNTREFIAEELNISRRSVRYRMNALEKKGYDVERDSDGVWSIKGMSETEEDNTRSKEETKPRREDVYDKAQNVKDTHNALTKLEKEVKEALSNTNPVLNVYDRTDGNSTLVLPHSDSHVGAIIKDRPGVDYYSAEEARGAIREYFDRAINHALDRGDVEDVVLIMNGDHLDGEGVFPGQRHEQDDNLRDQLRKAGNTYIEQILKLSREFESVEVYCVPGNHGNIDKDSTTNADLMLFDFIETALDYSSADNIRMEKANAAGYKTFHIRGWKYFKRHGENYLKHVGTSSGIRRVLQWYAKENGFDVGLRSHYHSVKLETVGDEVPIVMTGTTAPPSTFAESKGEDGGETATFWYTTDESAIDSFQHIRINED